MRFLTKHLVAVCSVLLWLSLSAVFVDQASGQTDESAMSRFIELIDQHNKIVKQSPQDRDVIAESLDEVSEEVFELVDEVFEPDQAIFMLNWIVNHNPSSDNAKKCRQLVIDQYIDVDSAASLLMLGVTIKELHNGSNLLSVEQMQAMQASSSRKVKAAGSLLLAASQQDEDQREQMLLKVVEEYGQVTLGYSNVSDLADKPLAELLIRVGKKAPEIIGKDTDNVEFKLSDYRGKIVMLDFWGDW